MASADPPSFAALLRLYRREAGLTQEALAERAGVSARAVSDLERGLYLAPRRDTVSLLIEALGLPPPEAARLEEAIDRRRGPRPESAPQSAPDDASEGQADGLPDGPPAFDPLLPGGPEGAPSPLPVALTALIGREREAAALSEALLEPSVRLVTLAGPAGVGKTRLSLHVAGAVRPHFSDGAIFVPLEAVVEADLVLPAIARAAAVGVAPHVSWEAALAGAMQDRHLLLLLDNFEQVLRRRPADRLPPQRQPPDDRPGHQPGPPARQGRAPAVPSPPWTSRRRCASSSTASRRSIRTSIQRRRTPR